MLWRKASPLAKRLIRAWLKRKHGCLYDSFKEFREELGSELLWVINREK